MTTKQKEKSLQTRQELMASALKLFGEKGFMATTVAEITTGAGYAKGSFYRHWQSKDQIFLDILEQKLGRYRADRNGRIAKVHTLDQALDVIWDFLDSIVEDKDWSKIFLEFTVHAMRDSDLRAALNKDVYRLSNAIFADLVGDFVNTDFPPEKLGALNTALFEGFLIHHALGTGVLDKTDIRKAAKALALAYCTDKRNT